MQFVRLPVGILADHRLKPSDKLVLMALQKFGWLSKESFASDGTIAGAAALSRRTVQSSLDRLEELGFIREEPDKSNPTGRKFLLLWLSDPTYLPPIRKPKPKRSKREGVWRGEAVGSEAEAYSADLPAGRAKAAAKAREIYEVLKGGHQGDRIQLINNLYNNLSNWLIETGYDFACGDPEDLIDALIEECRPELEAMQAGDATTEAGR